MSLTRVGRQAGRHRHAPSSEATLRIISPVERTRMQKYGHWNITFQSISRQHALKTESFAHPCCNTLYCTNIKRTVDCDSRRWYSGGEGRLWCVSRLMMAIVVGWCSVFGGCVFLLWWPVSGEAVCLLTRATGGGETGAGDCVGSGRGRWVASCRN
jgi:hypothetical protein